MNLEPDGFEQRWQDIQQIHKDYNVIYRLAGAVTFIGFAVIIGKLIYPNDTGYGTNLYTEFISISITVFILDSLARQREERNEIQRLVRAAAGRSNEIAKDAIAELRHKGLVQEGKSVLVGVDAQGAELIASYLGYVNMSRANLYKANLNNVDLYYSNLSRTNLRQANLSGAKSYWTNFSHACLHRSKLCNAVLDSADFFCADLREAQLEGADLRDADLTNALLTDAKFSIQTFLPDRTYWTPDIDLGKYTDPSHLDYWRSTDTKSPAKHTRSQQ